MSADWHDWDGRLLRLRFAESLGTVERLEAERDAALARAVTAEAELARIGSLERCQAQAVEVLTTELAEIKARRCRSCAQGIIVRWQSDNSEQAKCKLDQEYHDPDEWSCAAWVARREEAGDAD